MNHETSLIATVAVSLAFAFIGGYIAVRLRLPPMVGYLLAGIAVGPFTPGFVADTRLAPELAEIGVVLLMFGIGMHFSLGDLLAVRSIALPGAIAQILVSTTLGVLVALAWGWTFGAGLVFGLALSVASTVVLLRALEALDSLNTREGKIAVGWLIVEDLVTVVILVVLPPLSGLLGGVPSGQTPNTPVNLWLALGLTLAKVIVFIVIMMLVGRRFFPWLLKQVEKTGSRELFTLAVVALALGIAFGATKLFGVSLALGAFFAGMVVNGSDLSHRAAVDLQPLQDSFAALFFVAVGMLFDPGILLRQPLQVLIVLGIIILGKSLAALGIMQVLKKPINTGLTISAALAQIGEFSFILAGLGTSLKLLPAEGSSLILAGALISITLNPLLFYLAGRLKPSPVSDLVS
jgi:monovalent cation:H+ antiporter-2, CPA2 family